MIFNVYNRRAKCENHSEEQKDNLQKHEKRCLESTYPSGGVSKCQLFKELLQLNNERNSNFQNGHLSENFCQEAICWSTRKSHKHVQQ